MSIFSDIKYSKNWTKTIDNQTELGYNVSCTLITIVFRLGEEVVKLEKFNLVFNIEVTDANEAAKLLEQAVFELARSYKILSRPLNWASLVNSEGECVLQVDKWGDRYAPGTFG